MSYLAGSQGLSAMMGIADDSPHITCDGCSLRRSVLKDHGLPYAWFMNGKPAPGWSLKRVDAAADGTGFKRTDLCPRCKVKS